ncbi:hypothetical protein BPY_07070 [Bifidobacterium psychraerophilum]|uniref:hypothetical protein n=1 Tax=Bifidobacterium psychraerophilum TaxID=218140 RepID=UPI00311836A8
MSDIDHEYMDEIVCPYCGYVFGDSWEFSSDDFQSTECDECGRLFMFHREVEITYCSSKPTAERQRVFGGEELARCAICGSKGHTEYKCQCCDHFVCRACEQANRVCCTDYQMILDQCRNEVTGDE